MPCCPWVSSRHQENIICLPTLVKLFYNGNILKYWSSKPMKIVKFLFVIPSIFLVFLCFPCYFFLLDMLVQHFLNMVAGVYQLLWLLKFCVTTFLHICLLWNKKIYFEQHFVIAFFYSTVLIKWSIRFIRLYS